MSPVYSAALRSSDLKALPGMKFQYCAHRVKEAKRELSGSAKGRAGVTGSPEPGAAPGRLLEGKRGLRKAQPYPPPSHAQALVSRTT